MEVPETGTSKNEQNKEGREERTKCAGKCPGDSPSTAKNSLNQHETFRRMADSYGICRYVEKSQTMKYFYYTFRLFFGTTSYGFGTGMQATDAEFFEVLGAINSVADKNKVDKTKVVIVFVTETTKQELEKYEEDYT